MKKKISNIISVILTLIMLTGYIIPVHAASTTPTLAIDSTQAVKGSNVSLRLSVSNNPGMAAATFKIIYDGSILKLNSVDFNTEFGGDFDELGSLGLPVGSSDTLKAVQISWSSMSNITTNGTFLTMAFTVDSDAKKDSIASVKVVYNSGDFCNIDEEDITFSTVNGGVTVVEGIPGDINGDKVVNSKDLIRLRKYFTGWDVEVDILACDCNGDGNVNSKDLIRLRKYFSGWAVELMYGSSSTSICKHTLTKVVATEATCTEPGNIEYWLCNKCNKCYADENALSEITAESTVIEAKGHTTVVDPAVEPTYESEGLTEGSHCSVCGTVFKKQEPISKLQKTEYSITYHMANNDNYLQSLNIKNPNESVYTSQDGLELKDLIVDGYEFKGWYTAQTGGTRITEIPKKTTGNKTFYAQWKKVEYTIDFDSPDAPVSSITYTVDRGTTLTNPSWFGYTFVGWSKDGNIVSLIKPGTTGNMVLHANWTSNRNKARAVEKLDSPNIIEDADNGRYVFVYEIGTIENVPLSHDEIGDQVNSEGITITKELSMSKAVQKGTADKIAKTVAKATTETSSWTLSENWNESTSATNEHDEQIGKTQERVDSEGNVIAGKYYVSNSKGGSTSVSSSVGGSSSNSSKVTNSESVGINGEYSHKEKDGTSVNTTTSKTKEKEFNWNLGGKYGQSSDTNVKMDLGEGLSAGASKGSNWSINGGIGGSTKNSTTTTKSKTSTHEEENAYKISNSRNFNVGTENSSTSEGHWDTSSSSSSNWNSTSGYESSKQTSKNTTVSNAMSEVIYDRYAYTSTDSRGGNNSSTRSTADTASLSDEYASTVEYSVENTESEKKTLQFKCSATGYYRIITAGTVHVFGVVGYDIATNSYFTYTYNVLDKERHPYLDYSKDNPGFNDCENGVIPFEIPYEVNDYISVKIGRSDGLVVSEAGVISGYNGNAEYVVVPEYISASDGFNKAKAVKVTGFSETAFKGKTKIKGVLLPKHIRKIPDRSFEGCTSLQTLIAMGINTIGTEAFKNCTSLKTFIVDEFVMSLGKNAFVNVPEVYINAANESVAKSAFDSGAKKLLVYLSNMTGSLDNYKISVPPSVEFFAFMSDGREYKNLSIDSSASETFLSNFKLTGNHDTPLKVNSDTITLSRVKIENCPGFSFISTKDNANLRLYGNIHLISNGENAILTKNVNLSLVNNGVDGLIDTTGNWLISGDVFNSQKLSINYTNGKLIPITNEKFDAYLTSSKLSFDSNGGNVISDTKTIYYGQNYGELPIPTRDNYTFEGWYSSKDGGNRITSNTPVDTLANQTLYAHWTPKKFVITYDSNGEGSTVDINSKTLTYNEPLGSLPTPTRDYYTFDGWYTAKEGGNVVKPDTKFDSAQDITLYAHWTKNPTSDWVLASAIPAGASVVDQKWTYDLTSKISSSSSSMSGWTKYDTKRTGWGGTQGPVYSNPSNGSRNVWSEQYVTSTTTHYVYYHRYKSNQWSDDAHASSWARHSGPDVTSPLPNGYYSPTTGQRYSGAACSVCGATNQWHLDRTYTTDNYGTRWYYQEPVYTYYYKKTEAKESTTEVTASDSISNVQKYVKYILK